ncbi:uncharacterized protein TM35_000191320 [Trypanosoma theileri]|uniref:Uncharacterized protein n=1 Tax=Trypanosoma theileri TaxID=67003 RepID=A0A1X0NTM4_9TRYP|nr:uncharacterized protein TM35_000191320 [Trypanosoma theileri]ORC87888.1 hypothetical protein TM35_000191320 [Trypanosoma theileri]
MCNGSIQNRSKEWISSSFLEFKKHQASLLFIVWDEEDGGRIECRQLRPILCALFPSDGVAKGTPSSSTAKRIVGGEVFTLREIREACITAAGEPWSQHRMITLNEMFAIMDALWADGERRTRMVRACLHSVFTSFFGEQEEVTKVALMKASQRVTGTSIGAGEAESILRTAATNNSTYDTLNFEKFCELLLPTLTQE